MDFFKHIISKAKITLCILAWYSLSQTTLAQQYLPIKIDSLTALLSEKMRDSDKMTLLRQIGWEYRNIDLLKSTYYIQQSLQIALKIKNQKGVADLTRLTGVIYGHYYYHDIALEWFFKALKLSESLKDTEGVGFCYDNLGVMFHFQRQHSKALAYFVKAEQIFQQDNHQEGLGYVYTHLNWCCIAQKDYDKALHYGFRALNLRQKLGDTHSISNTLRDIGLAYKESGKPEDALKYIQEAITKAEKLRKELLKADHLNHLADVYLRLKQDAKALQVAQESFAIAQRNKNSRQLLETTKTLYDIHLFRQEYKAAIYYQNIRYANLDTLYNQDTKRRAEILNIKFDNERKAQEMLVQQARKDVENERLLFKQQLLTYLSVAAAVLFLIILYYTHRSKQQASLNAQNMYEKNQEISAQNEEISAQSDKLQELNTLKDRIFSIISHDFAGPLLSMSGLLNLVKEQIIAEKEFKDFIPELQKNIDSTSELLYNLLNWAKSQLEGVALQPINFSLKEVAESKIHLLEKQATQKGIRLHNQIQEDVQAFADKDMIELVIRNLVSNAIKFCSAGQEITIKGNREQEFTKICVEDTGIGIAPEHIRRVLGNEMFTTPGTSREKGTGLGLILCKDFIEKNGGKIWVESELNKGSRFYFTIPTAEKAFYPPETQKNKP
jgi:signal transduction histidine kinase